MAEDVSIKPLLLELSACLCAEVGTTDLCFCGVVAGQGIPASFVGECNGAAYVRLVTAFYSSSFPTPDATPTCNSALAFTIAVGVLRPAVQMDDYGNIDSAAVEALSLQVLDDAASARRAIRCCLADKFDDIDHVMGEWTPIEDDGVAGGEWTVTVEGLA